MINSENLKPGVACANSGSNWQTDQAREVWSDVWGTSAGVHSPAWHFCWKGVKVSACNGKANETYTVLKIADGKALCLPKNGREAVEFDVPELVTTAELGNPIYPCLQPLGVVCNAPNIELWHTLIEADNYHAYVGIYCEGFIQCASEQISQLFS